MREILFRGKRIDNEEWAHGYIVKHGECLWIYTGEASFVGGHTNEYGLPMTRAVKYEVDSETVCQYTGLTDKNGKKIFEGDIVKTKFFGKCRGDFNFADYDIFKIIYDKGAFYFENSTRKFLIDERAKAEIIGNIFDNPELLEVRE